MVNIFFKKPLIYIFKEKILLSAKIFKYNYKGKKQERLLLVTSKYVYNLSLNKIKDLISSLISSIKIKRKIAIDKIAAITLSKKGDEFVIHVPDEYDYRQIILKLIFNIFL